MKKIVFTIASLLLLPSLVLAADELTFDADTTITVNGENLTVVSGSIVDQMVVNESSIIFSLSGNSKITVTSYNKKILNNNLTDYICTDSYSQMRVIGSYLGTSLSVSPSSEACVLTTGSPPAPTAPSGGGGGTVTPSKPMTTNGEVAATASGGGKTTLNVSGGTIASVDLPANAVSVSTAVKIEAVDKSAVVDSRPVPGVRKVVGGFIYNYTATVNNQTVSSFSKDVTLTLTYTDSQISSLDESTLKIYYWRETTSQWMAMVTAVDAVNNTLTVMTDHFTYFAIMGLSEGIIGGEESIFDGDLVRNPNAEGMAQFDVYIVKIVNDKKYKRLILSPHVFESYEHFDKSKNGSPWDDIKDISQSSMDEYAVSSLVRAVGDEKVYYLSTTEGSDTGTKQWLNMTAEQFLSQYDTDLIYEINATDRDAYSLGSDI